MTSVDPQSARQIAGRLATRARFCGWRGLASPVSGWRRAGPAPPRRPRSPPVPAASSAAGSSDRRFERGRFGRLHRDCPRIER